jgi:hypothetical protein
MSLIYLQCKNCQRIFSSGIDLGTGATIILKGNLAGCPFCGSMESIPDGTFRGTVNGIGRVLRQSENPVVTAKELFEALERSKTSKDLDGLKQSSKFSKFKKWLPDSPEKIAAYIAIAYTIFQLLLKEPNVVVQYNQQFISIYNDCFILRKEK